MVSGSEDPCCRFFARLSATTLCQSGAAPTDFSFVGVSITGLVLGCVAGMRTVSGTGAAAPPVAALA